MMTTPDFSWLRIFIAFAVVLALMTALSFTLKYLSSHGIVLPTKHPQNRRLKMIESLPIDPKRRLAIVRCDDHEHLLLLGGSNDIVIETNLPSSKSASSL